MTTVHIEESTPEGRWQLDLFQDHKSMTIEPQIQQAKHADAWSEAIAAGAVPLEEFNARFETKIQETDSNNA